ncbi:hypothetical protein GCM10023196_069190 [Actinoallomurus vinaceus]|uniref:Uncharacterized protein n=1 Tax=Actinoallomurus vinaceus TaxID=1080074 RepID=A0ABP8UK19_9ACTN
MLGHTCLRFEGDPDDVHRSGCDRRKRSESLLVRAAETNTPSDREILESLRLEMLIATRRCDNEI